jgi:uncharacterized protein YeaO (DUF488 family)
MISIKRVYEPASPEDGQRYLVDRLWPRGIKKDSLKADGWIKEVAPSDGLRHWFGHDPEKWCEFNARYFKELDGKTDAWRPLLETARKDHLTLLYSTKELQHNNAVSLRAYLEQQLKMEA